MDVVSHLLHQMMQKKSIDDKERTQDILRGESRNLTAREEQELLSIDNVLPNVKNL